MSAFKNRTRRSGSILVTSVAKGAEAYGEVGGIFANGGLTFFSSVAEAAEQFGDLQHEHADLVAKVDRLVRAGRTAQALSLFGPDQPLSVDEFSKLMQILLKQRAHEDITRRCEAEIEDESELTPEALFYLATIAAEEGRHDDVTRFAEDFDEVGGDYERIAILAGKSYEVLGLFEPAAAAYLRRSDSPSGTDLRAAIRCLIRAERWEKAKDLLYSEGIKVDAGILERRTQVLAQLGTDDDYEASIVALAQANGIRGWSAAIAARRRLSAIRLVNLILQLPPELPSQSSANEMKALVFFLNREIKTASASEAPEISALLSKLAEAPEAASEAYEKPVQ